MSAGRRLGGHRPLEWAAYGILLVLFALLITGTRGMAPTADETAHMAGGYALVTMGGDALDVLSQRGYPPLMPALQGALIRLSEPGIAVAEIAGWPDAFDVYATSFAAALPVYDRALFVSRLPAIWMTVLAGVIVYRWAGLVFRRTQGTGRLAGLLAVGLCWMDPTLLAHGRLATTDAGVTFFGLTALYAAWRWMQWGGWRWSLVSGLFLGATLASKVSGPLWAGVVGLMMLDALLRRPAGDRAGHYRLAHLLVAVGLALLLLWGAYGFAVGPLGDTGLNVPAPNHWRSTFYLTEYHSLFFALGERQQESWWWYFPVAFLIKNPLPLLIAWWVGLLALLSHAGVRAAIWRGEGRSRMTLSVILAFPILYTVVATVEGMNIGYRHMLPIHPLLHIVGGAGLARLWTRRPSARRLALWVWVPRVGMVALGLAGLVVTWRSFPNELAFFSSLIGGPDQGYRYLVDSNLDWGQNEPASEAYVATHPGAITEPPPTSFRPAPGRYIVGASELQGVGAADAGAYAWFRHQEPVEQPVPGLLVYDVAPFAPQWVAQCAAPDAPLTAEQIASELGPDLRLVAFDCTETWLVPQGGAVPGIYALPVRLLAPREREFPTGLLAPAHVADEGLRRWLTPARLSYVNRRAVHPFALYEFDPAAGDGPLPGVSLPPQVQAIVPASAAVAPSALMSTNPPVAEAPACPCALEGPLTLLGVTVHTRGDVLEVETWWRVDAGPVRRNFSLLGQLVDASGNVLAAADGLGVFPTTLLPGDHFIQRHRFPDPDGAASPVGKRWFRTGAYWLDTKTRWSTGSDGADLLLVAVP